MMAHIRPSDKAIMAEVAPHQFVALPAAVSLGLVTPAAAKLLAANPPQEEEETEAESAQ